MRILALDQFSELGGAQRCLLDWLPAAQQAGWQVQVGLPGPGPLGEALARLHIPVHFLPLGPYSLGRKTVLDGIRFLAELPKAAARIRALARSLDVSLLYVNGPRLMPAASRAGAGRPVVFHSHNLVPAANGGKILAAALRQTGATVIAASRFLAESLSRPEARVIYSGVEAPAVPRPPADGVFRVGLIGRIAPEKRQKEFALAARQVAARRPDVEFCLCGDALFGDRRGLRYKEELLALAGGGLRWLGWREPAQEVLATLDLLVAPWIGEGLPRVILEAFAARVPVLACASGGIPEAVREAETGFLLPSFSSAAIAGRIKELRNSPDRLAAAAEGGHRLWRERFTLQRYRAEILEVLESARASSRQNSPAASARPPTSTPRAAG